MTKRHSINRYHPKLRHLLAGGVAIAVVGTIGIGTAAFDSSPSVGKTTTHVSGQLLDLSANGGALHLSLLSDSGNTSLDPSAGVSSAKNTLLPLIADGSAIPASALSNVQSLTTPQVVEAPGGLGSVDLSSLKMDVSGIASGTLDSLKLNANADPQAGSTSGLNASLSHLSLLGGLISIDTLSDQDSMQCGQIASDARSVNIGHVGVLSLGALLGVLGIDPAQLPLTTVTNLLNQLNLPGLPTSAVTSQVSGLLGAVTNLLSTPLLEVDSGPLTVKTKAASSVADSLADAQVPMATVKVGGQALPSNIPLASIVSTVQSLVSSLLGAINPGLTNVVTISPPMSKHSVTNNNGTIDAVAQATGLSITIDPTKATDLSGILGSLPLLGSLGTLGSLPGLGGGGLPGLGGGGLPGLGGGGLPGLGGGGLPGLGGGGLPGLGGGGLPGLGGGGLPGLGGGGLPGLGGGSGGGLPVISSLGGVNFQFGGGPSGWMVHGPLSLGPTTLVIGGITSESVYTPE